MFNKKIKICKERIGLNMEDKSKGIPKTMCGIRKKAKELLFFLPPHTKNVPKKEPAPTSRATNPFHHESPPLPPETQ